MTDQLPLSGRRAIVTGASRGIGAATAERLAAEGADVAIVARTLAEHDHLAGSLNETAARVAVTGREALVLTADLSDGEARAGIVPAAVHGLGGPIDILVNNAAAAIYAPTDTYPLNRRRVTFEVNVHAPLDLAQAVLPGMLERGEGWIVNLTSASARPIPAPTLTVYGASKAALNRMTLGLAHELAGRGVRINTIEPRVAVLSEGAAILVGDRLAPEMIESMEEMVEAVVALCRCGPELSGRCTVSLDLIDELGLTVHALDGSALLEPGA
jgi:citronellol/citronellal dehydrogenase